MKKIRHHAGVVLVEPITHLGSGRKFIFSVYDNKYPVVPFRGHYVPIGGTANGHSSPLETVTIELEEELQDEHFSEETPGTLFSLTDSDSYVKRINRIDRNAVSLSLRNKFKRNILTAIKPIRDYLVSLDGKKIGSEEESFEFVYSWFGANIEKGLFYNIAEQLKAGKELINEGLTRVADLDMLIKGELRGAWGAGAIIGDIFSANVPEYSWIHIEPLGSIQGSYQDYKKYFSYARDPEIKAR